MNFKSLFLINIKNIKCILIYKRFFFVFRMLIKIFLEFNINTLFQCLWEKNTVTEMAVDILGNF